MQTSVEQLEGLERRLTVVLPAEQVEKAYSQQLKEIAKTAKIDGFRPGKAPLDVIEKKFGSGISQDVVSKLVQETFYQALEQNHLQIAGTPRVQPNAWTKGQALEYVVTFETFPEIKLVDLAGQKIETILATVAETDIADMLQTIQKQFAHWHKVDRASAKGDRVVIDFEGFLNNEAFKGGKATDYALELGSQSMIPGFEEGLIGLSAGESKDLEITFPENYPNAELAGKPVVFKIKVHVVEESHLPELNDELADKVGVKAGLEGLKAEVRKQMELELDRVLTSRNKVSVLDKLVELNPIALPKGLVDVEIKHLQDMTLQQMAAQQGKQELPKIDMPRDLFVEQAERRVKLGLLLAEVIKHHALKVNDDKVKSKVNELAASYQKPEEVVSWYYSNKEMLAEIEAVVLEDDAVSKLLEKAEVAQQTLSYKDALKPAEEKK